MIQRTYERAAAANWMTALMAGGLLLGAAARPAAADPRLRIVDYQPTSVLSLTGFVGYHVHFEFAPDERFVNLGAGDTASLDVGAEANHLLLKPRQPTSGTNLTILTNRRVYFVDYRAMARPPRADEAVYSIVFRYPPAAPAAEMASPAARAADASLHDARPPINQNYWFCGSPAIRPIYAADDGLQLRLRFAPQAELPAIYARATDGEETIVNSHVEGDTVVIHRLAERFVLRRGQEVACVVDRGPHGSGQRAGSGTVDPAVTRTTRAVRP